MIQATSGAGVIAYAYDPFGRRIGKNVNGTLTTYVYDHQNILAEYDGGNNLKARYTHGVHIDEPLAIKQGASQYYYHADGLGSIVNLTNAQGKSAQTYTYDSYGNVTPTGSVSQPFAFTGREYDQETGLYYYRARYFDPKAGRFITKDPIGFRGGDVNFYAYVQNNPVNKIDPSGLYETLFGRHYFEGADGWPWYGGWPFTGSLLPGYSSQDNICSYPVEILNKNSCTKKCCKSHDDCYTRFGCNVSSILCNVLNLSGACQMCNQQAAYCIMRNMGENNDCKCN